MAEHLFPKWIPLEHINDETYITTIAGYHVTISRTKSTWEFCCARAGIYDRRLDEKMTSLADVEKAAIRKVARHMESRISGANAFLSTVGDYLAENDKKQLSGKCTK